ncbi:MAG: putative porin [Gammaproteobacteria bacterium]
MRFARLTGLLLLLFACGGAAADGGRTELLEIRNTILNLVDALVEQGVLTKEKAEALKREAAAKAAADAQKEGALAAETEPAPAPASGPSKVVRVPYVPDFVKDEIRADVREELREEVLADVADKARDEGWGTPDALPDWVNRLTWHGDFRLRFQSTTFDDDNPEPGDPNAPLNFQAINDDQALLNNPDAFLNYSEDRHRVRARLRLGLTAEVLDSLDVGVRISTGNLNAPTSLNETLGNNFGRNTIGVDRMYMHWELRNKDDNARLALFGGRFERPFYSTELVWDNDISFDGFAGKARFRFADSGWEELERHQNALFLTLGVFPVDLDETLEDDGSSNDKWLFGGQFGIDYRVQSDIGLRMAFAYYDYTNIVGRLNRDTLVFNPGVTPDNSTDWSAPDLLGTGNTLFPIKFDSRQPFPPPILFGLASDYSLANLTAELNFSHFYPINIQLQGDIVKNLGFDSASVARRTGFAVDDRTLGYTGRIQIGHDEIRKFGDWRFSFAFKHVQADAVLDSFTDSNFLLGGTNAEGYIAVGHFGLSPRTFLRLRYYSADTIDGYNDNLVPGRDDTDVGIDVFQLDLNALF